MKPTTKALFGGALFAAGIAGAADAQWNVDQVYSFHQVFGSDGTNSYAYGSGMTQVNFPGPDLLGSGKASVSDTMARAEINIDIGPSTPYEFAQARSVAYVSVNSPQTAFASWDFTDVPLGGISYALIQVYDLTNYAYLLNYGTNTSGNDVPLNLVPGVDYVIFIAADSDAPSSMFGEVVIPAPAGLAVLGAGALGVRRRRRRT